MQGVHRAHFLDELIKDVPAQRADFNKHQKPISDEPDSPVLMLSKDGIAATADVDIGIHSAVREYLHGKEEAKPVFTGTVAYRGLVDMDKAVEKVGAEFAQRLRAPPMGTREIHHPR